MDDLTRTHAPRWRLLARQNPELPAPFAVAEGKALVLGRDGGCEIALSAERHPEVSSRHARVSAEDGRLFVEDLGSRNGVLVDGERIQGRREIEHGATIELGEGGPRFVALSAAKLDETVLVRRPALATQRPLAALGADTTRLVREQLGLPSEGRVEELVERRTRSNSRRIVLLAAIGVVAVGGTFFALHERAADDRRAVERENIALRAQLDEQRAAIAAQRAEWAERENEDSRLRTAWEAERAALEENAGALRRAIATIEASEASSRGQLDVLRARLEETNATLATYNPLTLLSERLDGVAKVERATVLIEADQVFRDERTGRLLHVDRAAGPGADLNLEDRGEIFALEATGSGFCVSADGYVITNAHVVHKKDGARPLQFGDAHLVPDVLVRVVFSGTAERHEARLVSWVADDQDDLALLAINPFPGMPWIAPPDPAAAPPPRGSDVFLIGFPLGKRVLHEEDRLLASTFRGVLSRVLEDYLQVDAAVHPGASGGPLIDEHGRVIGVVVGMQSIDENASASQIGYILPAAKVALVWPPREDDAGE